MDRSGLYVLVFVILLGTCAVNEKADRIIRQLDIDCATQALRVFHLDYTPCNIDESYCGSD